MLVYLYTVESLENWVNWNWNVNLHVSIFHRMDHSDMLILGDVYKSLMPVMSLYLSWGHVMDQQVNNGLWKAPSSGRLTECMSWLLFQMVTEFPSNSSILYISGLSSRWLWNAYTFSIYRVKFVNCILKCCMCFVSFGYTIIKKKDM